MTGTISPDILIVAAQAGDLPALQAALALHYVAAPGAAAGALDEPGRQGTYNALILAAKGGHTECVQALCDSGCDPNCSPPGMGGAGAMHMAAGTSGSEGAIRVLAAAGADLDQTDCDGTTPLMFAACQGCADNVCALLQLGANREAADGAGRTALMIAAQAGQDECVAALLSAGASASPCCPAGLDALAWAAAHGHSRCVELLAAATPAGARSAAVELAARAHSAACLQALAVGGMATAEATRALHAVVHSKQRLVSLAPSAQDAGKLAGKEAPPVPGGRAACIGALVAAGADADAAFPGGAGGQLLPLFYSCGEGDLECVRALLQSGALASRPRARDGATPLHAAASHPAVVRELLAHGARSAVALAEGGVTPLMSAAMEPSAEAVYALLEAPDAQEALEMRGASGKSALALAVWSHRHHGNADGAAAAIKALLAKGADVEAADKDGMRPLHWAAVSGFTAAARLLLAAGADPAAANPDGITPLALAQRFKHAGTERALTEAVFQAHAGAVAGAQAAGRLPPPLPAGVPGPVTSYTVNMASGQAEWLEQPGGTTHGLAPHQPPTTAHKQACCCCVQ